MSRVVRRGALSTGAAIVLPSLVLTLLAATISLSYATSDTLLLPIMSTQELTFFFWGQDRLANVLALSTSWIGDIEVNFGVQMAIAGTAWFSLPGIVARRYLLLTGRAPDVTVVGSATLATGLVGLVLLRDGTVYAFAFEQPYALSAICYLLGADLLLRSRPGPLAAGATLAVVAALVNPTSVLYAPLVWMARIERAPTARRRPAALVVGSGLALLATMAASAAFGDGTAQGERYRDFSVRRLDDALEPVTSAILQSLRLGPTLVAAVGATTLLLVRYRREPWPAAVPLAITLVGFAIGWWLLFSASLWIEMSGFAARYFFPVHAIVIAVVAAGAAEATVRLQERSAAAQRGLAVATAAASTIVLVIAIARMGRAEPFVARTVEPDVVAAEQFGAEVVAGDYWRVWPAVYVSARRGDALLGATERSEPLRDELVGRLESSPVTVLCLGRSTAGCADEVARAADSAVTVDGVESRSPLVVTLALDG